MDYRKPTVTQIAAAITAIQGSKGIGSDDSLHPAHAPFSVAAYEADE